MLAGASGGSGEATDPYRVSVVQTSASLSQALTPLPGLEFGPAKTGNLPAIDVNAAIRYQRITGFGGAMTDSSAWLIENKLNQAQRQTLMGKLFGPTGIRLNFVRVPIGASDFTQNGTPYTYDDVPAGQSDPDLQHFSIAHDQAYILPALTAVKALNPAIAFMATPWTPPAWMKTNDSLSNAGNKAFLRRRDFGAYAAYIVKFLQAYAQAGIPISSLTLQNEPGILTLYPGLNISAAAEATWLTGSLRPALAKANLHPNLYGGDRGWGPTTDYFTTSIKNAGNALSGLAWHCYFGEPGVMSPLHDEDPRLGQIVDECSPGLTPTPISEVVISSLRNWVSVVSLWNLALDQTGGPAQLPNHGCKGCQGIVTIPLQGGGPVTLMPSYYELGQASEFIDPGAQRINTGNFVSYRYPHAGVNVATPGLDDVAVRNPDGSIVLIAYNNATAPITFAVKWRGRAFGYTLPAGATATFVWNRP
jgi:glucosylceramidase